MKSNFDGMKFAPVHKKDDVTNKSNYRPISGNLLVQKSLKELFRTKLRSLLKHV